MNRTQSEFNTSQLNKTMTNLKPLLKLQTPVPASVVMQALIVNKKGQSLTTKNNVKRLNSPKTENLFLQIKQIPIYLGISAKSQKHELFTSPSNHYLANSSKKNLQFQRAKTAQFMLNANTNTYSQKFTNKESVGSSANIILRKENDGIESISEENSNRLESTVRQSLKNILKIPNSSGSTNEREMLKLNLEEMIAQKNVKNEKFSKHPNKILIESNESKREIIEDLTKNCIINVNQSNIFDNIHYNNRNKDTITHLQSYTFSTTRPLSGISTKNSFKSSRFNFFPADRSFKASSSIKRPLTSFLPKRKGSFSQKVQFFDNSENRNNSKLLFDTFSTMDFKNRPFSAINLKRFPTSPLYESNLIIIPEPNLEHTPAINVDSPIKRIGISLEEKIKIMNERYHELNLDLDPIINKAVEVQKDSNLIILEGTLNNCN